MPEYNIGPIPINRKLWGQIITCWVFAGIIAFLSAGTEALSSEFVTTVATIQASVLGIVIAFYILTTQLAVDRFSVRIIEELSDGSVYELILSIFGISILSDVIVLLFVDSIQTSPYLTFVSIFCMITFGAVSFLSLFYSKDWLLKRPHPDTVTSSIESKLTTDSIAQKIQENSRPFLEIFESAKITIRSDDKRAAGDLVTAICNPLQNNLKDVLSGLSVGNTDSIKSIITQVSSISSISFNEGSHNISRYCLNWLLFTSKICYEQEFLDAGSEALQRSYPSLRDLMTKASAPDKTLAAINWNFFSEIYTAIGESGHENSILQSTNLVSNFSMDVEDSHEPITSGATVHSLSTLIDAFMDGWESYIQSANQLPAEEQVYWGDPKFLDIGQYEFLYNHYIDNFETIFRSVSRLESNSIAEAGIFEITRDLPRNICSVSKRAYDNGSPEIAVQLVQIAIIVGARFNMKFNEPEFMTKMLQTEYEDTSEFEDIISGIRELRVEDEVDLFNNTSTVSHFLSPLALENEENWFEMFQDYISQIIEEAEK